MATNTDINASGSGDVNAITSGSNAQYGLGSGVPTAPSVQNTATPQAASAATAPPVGASPSAPSAAPAAPSSTPGTVPSLIQNWDVTTANPAGGASVAPAAQTTALSPGATASTATDTSSGFDWSSLLGSLGSFLTGPGGSALAMIGLGEYEASQAESQTASLTSQLTGPSTPYVTAGTTELSQAMQGLTGAPVTGGSIGQQETAASELGEVAEQYGTGQLTQAQQLQVQQQAAAQKQAVATQLAAAGVTDSAVMQAYDTQIDNNTALLTQQLTQQNLTTAQSALSSVQQTYSTLLNQSVSSFAAGMGPIEDAVNITIQQDTAIANGLQQLFGNVAKALTAGGGTGGSSGSIGSILGGVGSAIGKALGLTSSTASTAATAGVDYSASTAATTGLGSGTAQWLDPSLTTSSTDLATGAPQWGGIAADANAAGAAPAAATGAEAALPQWGGIAADANAAGAAGATGAVAADASTAGATGLADVSGSLASTGSEIAGLDISGGGTAAGVGGAGAGDVAAGLSPLGAAAVGAIPVGLVAYGASQPAVSLGGSYWNNVNTQLTTPVATPPYQVTAGNLAQAQQEYGDAAPMPFQIAGQTVSVGQYNALSELAAQVATGQGNERGESIPQGTYQAIDAAGLTGVFQSLLANYQSTGGAGASGAPTRGGASNIKLAQV
jgi:hypothetical protein